MDNYEIFISYRRQGGQGYARALALELEVRGYRVFFDFDALKDGKFDKRIMEAIDSAPVFISVLSPNCLDRCVNADDWVRQEIEYAFKHERHIVPVNPDRLFRDLPDGTPDIICKALGHQFSDVMMTSLFKVSMDKMVAERIAPILGGRKAQSNSRNFASDTTGQGLFTSVLKVETDLDCRIFVDGEDRGMALTGNMTRVALRGGSYRLRFVSIENTNFVKEDKRYHIDRDTEEWYSVELMPLKKAAEEKKKQAETWLENGKRYYNEKNYAEAFSWFKKAAEQGLDEAQCDLGYCYDCGIGTATDKVQAVYWYKKAAEQGDAGAQCNLGYCYDCGIGTVTDKVQAVYWYKKAAEQGYAVAQYNLGYCYQYGEGTATDKTQTVYWYKKAAEQGYASAQYYLGYCYYHGEGTSTDKAQAFYWYKKAAEQGYANAQLGLGWCYDHGEGTSTDKAQAFYWYKKAAEQGDAGAQCNLGYCYQHGEGTSTDKAQAVYWYKKAAEQGDEKAQKNLKELTRSA